MTDEPLSALLQTVGVTGATGDWQELAGGRAATLHAASGGVSLTVSKVTAIKVAEELVFARTLRGEEYVLRRKDVFAGAVDAESDKKRTAGFV